MILAFEKECSFLTSERSTDYMNKWMIGELVCWLVIDRLIYCLTDWLTDRLTDWLIVFRREMNDFQQKIRDSAKEVLDWWAVVSLLFDLLLDCPATFFL